MYKVRITLLQGLGLLSFGLVFPCVFSLDRSAWFMMLVFILMVLGWHLTNEANKWKIYRMIGEKD